MGKQERGTRRRTEEHGCGRMVVRNGPCLLTYIRCHTGNSRTGARWVHNQLSQLHPESTIFASSPPVVLQSSFRSDTDALSAT